MSLLLKRRDLLALLGGSAAFASPANAQISKMPVVGLLKDAYPERYADLAAAVVRGLAETGFVIGKNVAVEYRWSDGKSDRIPALAAELVHRKVDVIFAGGSAEAQAAKAATATIPIVFTGGSDPVAIGLVASLNRPGGNVTGVTTTNHGFGSKRLDILRQLNPNLAVVAVIVATNNPSSEHDVRELLDAAKKIGARAIVNRVDNDAELEAAFEIVVEQKIGDLVVGGGPFFGNRRLRLAELSSRNAIRTIYGLREYVVDGGLMSYGTNFVDTHRLAGTYVGRILQGVRPADLPVMQSDKFELVINLKTAKELAATIPPMLLALADEVIE